MRIRETIIVEGRYDKCALASFIESPIVETRGFGVYNDGALLSLIRRLAKGNGVVILTDPDGAGFQIRGYLKGAVTEGRVLHAYVPDIYGRERRKSSLSGEGKLGVEGMRPEVLLEALRRAGATPEDGEPGKPAGRLTKADLYRLGLSGRRDSAAKRAALLKKLELPERLPANSLLDVINALMTPAELERLFAE